jgi:tetratricopeptide (TPR) repeat protein
MELGRWDEALSAFDRSIEIKLAHDQTAKGTAYTRTRKARVLMHMGKTEQARSELELALEEHASKKDPDQNSVGATWFRLAKLERSVGDRAAAREAGLKAQVAYATSKSEVGAEVEAFLAGL